MKDYITDSLARSGYSHVLKTRITEEELQNLCSENGWRIDDTTAHYTYTVVRDEEAKQSNTDWERIRKEQHERRQKAAHRRKAA